MAQVRTHYDNLKVTRDAPAQVIWAAHQVLIAKYSPHAEAHSDVAEILRIINRSYDVLSDPAKRAEHDRWIAERSESEFNPRPSSTVPPASATPLFRGEETKTKKWMPLVFAAIIVACVAVASIFLTGSKVTTSAPQPPAAPASAMPDTLLTDPKAVLDPIPVDRTLKANAWEAYRQATSPDDFKAKFDKIAIPDSAKSDLWNMKFKGGIKALSGLTPPPVAQPSQPTPVLVPKNEAATARAVRPAYIRPALAPNGEPWPDVSAYLLDQTEDGSSTIAIDNTNTSSDMVVELFDLGVRPPTDVRVVFLRAREQFALKGVRVGNYDIRYLDLDSGVRRKSQQHKVGENRDYSLTLYTVPDGNDAAVIIGPDEFDSTFLSRLPRRH